MIGGFIKRLTGQTDAHVRASQVNTAAGQRAIAAQMRAAQQGANARAMGMAASARGSSGALALREAQRQGAQAEAAIGTQSGVLQQQLQQQAATQNAQLQQQAAMQNAQFQAQNDQALSNTIKGVAMAGAGGMMLSDARAKHAAFLAGQESAAAAQAPAAQQPSERDKFARGLMLSGIGQISDDRAKAEHSAGSMEFPDGVRPVKFHYRDGIEGMPGAPPGEHVGVLAQDLERSPEGATVVGVDPATGMKSVDTQQLTMLLTAKLAELDGKIDKLTGAKKSSKKRKKG